MIVYAFILDKDGRKIEKALKTRRWGTVGRDGSRVLLELDEYGVPIGEEGCFLRQVNGKIVKNRQFDIGAKNWHKVTTAQKDHVFDNHIRPKFCWNDEDEKTIRKYVMSDLGKKWREDRQKLWNDVCDKEGTKEENYLKRPQRINEVQWENFINYRMGKEMKVRLFVFKLIYLCNILFVSNF
ncbi:hypothetical protein LINGRAPRIM_LOCUS63 [Linum grandiflorum]